MTTQPSSSGPSYKLGHMEEVLVGVEDWGRGIRMGKWNQSIIPVGRVHPYNEHWANLVTVLQLKTGCNAVDIGANDGFLSSNSFNFIQWGWDAVLVDHQPRELQTAKKNLQK